MHDSVTKPANDNAVDTESRTSRVGAVPHATRAMDKEAEAGGRGASPRIGARAVLMRALGEDAGFCI